MHLKANKNVHVLRKGMIIAKKFFPFSGQRIPFILINIVTSNQYSLCIIGFHTYICGNWLR